MLKRNWKKLIVLAALIIWALVITIEDDNISSNVADNSQYLME